MYNNYSYDNDSTYAIILLHVFFFGFHLRKGQCEVLTAHFIIVCIISIKCVCVCVCDDDDDELEQLDVHLSSLRDCVFMRALCILLTALTFAMP